MSRTLVTPPALEPITLDDAKTHVRADLSSTAEDGLLSVLIAAARGWAEGYTNRVFVTQTWQEAFDRFPSGCDTPRREGYGWSRHPLRDQSDYQAIRLGLAPVIEVTSVRYVDAAGATQTLATDQYVVDVAALPARIRPAYGVSWPTTRAQANAVTVEYTAGYGDRALDVPGAIRAAILLMLGDLYANRERQIVGTITNENPAAAALLGPYRVLEAV